MENFVLLSLVIKYLVNYRKIVGIVLKKKSGVLPIFWINMKSLRIRSNLILISLLCSFSSLSKEISLISKDFGVLKKKDFLLEEEETPPELFSYKDSSNAFANWICFDFNKTKIVSKCENVGNAVAIGNTNPIPKCFKDMTILSRA